ncbi:hypothetical protein [Aquimarina megaterium]|uniref:hypothetical protein n=1 Tax=Aquimarina megaterium TaxID=1443666 RepID=UPI0004BC7ABD|nr:hypothetical protein [Aquimarina megaterium]
MNLIRLKNISDNYFQQAWKLYENVFPVVERRILDAQTHMMKKSIPLDYSIVVS